MRDETTGQFVDRTLREMHDHLAKWNDINAICWMVVGFGSLFGISIAALWCLFKGSC